MAENLTEEQLADYKTVFTQFDKNQDGLMSFDELKLVIDELGFFGGEVELKSIMAELDIEENKLINFATFLAVMARRLLLSDNEEEMLEAFKVFDKDNNGQLSAAELKSVLTTLGEKLTPEECDEIVKLADKDGDGVINYREFVRSLLTK